MPRDPSTSKPPASPREWLGGRVTVPLESDALRKRLPSIVLWYELPSEQVVWFRLCDPRARSALRSPPHAAKDPLHKLES